MKPPLPAWIKPFRQIPTFVIFHTKKTLRSAGIPSFSGHYCRHGKPCQPGQASFSRFRSLMVLLLLAAFLPVSAQPAIQWDKTLGANSLESLASLQQTSDGVISWAGGPFQAAAAIKPRAAGEPQTIGWSSSMQTATRSGIKPSGAIIGTT
jgi:hypothetical protein